MSVPRVPRRRDDLRAKDGNDLVLTTILEDLRRCARRCTRAANGFEREPAATMLEALSSAADEVGEAWSGGILGYHSTVYKADLKPKRPGDFFDTQWGPHASFNGQTQGDWAEFSYIGLIDEIERRANVSDRAVLEALGDGMTADFDECRAEVLPLIDALLNVLPDTTIEKTRAEIAKLKSYFSETDFFQGLYGGKSYETRDARAGQGGIQAPAHIKVQLWVVSQRSRARALIDLASKLQYIIKYLETAQKLKGIAMPKAEGKIFIGHGRSAVWRDLKDFLHERLNLKSDEFNRESAAGVPTTDRLNAMLDEAAFAFLVMTAEDEQADKTKHARANVIHEAGLFQGRLGFRRAILLLEEGCEEFSNIVGLGQIRFRSGDLKSQFEEIRRVLERENIV